MSARYVVTNIVLVPEDRARQLRATFDLQIGGVGTIRACRVLEDDSKRYVLGPSLRDHYRGWFQVVQFEKDVAEEILAAYEQAFRAERLSLVDGSAREK